MHYNACSLLYTDVRTSITAMFKRVRSLTGDEFSSFSMTQGIFLYRISIFQTVRLAKC